MDQHQIAEFYRSYFYYILGIQILIGFLMGLVPLILGIKRGKRNLGIITFLVCGVVGGALSPLLSLVIAIVVSILITRNKATVQSDGADTAIDS